MSQPNVYASPTVREREPAWIDVRAWVSVGVSGAVLATPIAPYAMLALSLPSGDGVEFMTRPSLSDLVPGPVLWVALPVIAGLFATGTLALCDVLWRRPVGRIGVLRGIAVGFVSCILFGAWLGVAWPLEVSLRTRLGSGVYGAVLAGMLVGWLTALVGGFVALVHDRARASADPVGEAATPGSPSS